MELNPIDFSLEFIARLRRSRDVVVKPSTRQALAIPQLLIARRLRTGRAPTARDLIEAAVCTSLPENQEVAERIAEQIVFLLPVEDEPSHEHERADLAAEIAEELDAIRGILAELDLARTLGGADVQKVKDFALSAHHDGWTLRAIDILGGDRAVLQRLIATREELENAAREELRGRIGSLTPQELDIAASLGLSDDIAQRSPRRWESAAAQVFGGQKPPEEALQSLLSEKQFPNFPISQPPNLADAAKFLQFLREGREAFAEKATQLAGELYEQAQTLEDLLHIAKATGATPSPDVLRRALEHATRELDYVTAYQLAFALDDWLQLNVVEQLVDAWWDAERAVSVHDLARYPCRSEAWYHLLQKSIGALERSTVSAFEHANALHAAAADCPIVQCARHLVNAAHHLAHEAIAHAETAEQLKSFVKSFQSRGFALDAKIIEKRGAEIGLSQAEIAELLSPSFRNLLRAIQSGVEDFERLTDMLQAVEPTAEQLEQLTRAALKAGNTGALGALAHWNLGEVLNAANAQGGQKAMELVVSALSAGPGENLLVQWFNCRERVPRKIKDSLQAMVKELLIGLGVHYARARLGSSETGVVPATTVRPYLLGDDDELVDVDETIENLLSKGKTIDMIDYDDFLVAETVHGRRAVCIALDVSGSMSGEKLAYMAICTTMLVYAMRRDELALCFFESDTHVVKDLHDEEVDIEEIADDLLTLQPMGGTMVSKALQWASQNFKATAAQDKLCVIFTDGEIFDLEESLPHLRALRALRVSQVLVVPAFEYSLSGARELAKQGKAHLVTLQSWRDFPGVMGQVVRG
ncbi:MAG: VWA domain-containing protein [Abditibacteriales bacterium]|nr:VWA domain-containing protein [Abditibacteriales bacterium]MDW8364556.1 VWA domain-containing protein [Abditibacteriales bacterium]